MEKGEKYVFAKKIISNFSQANPDTKLNFFYDVGCQLVGHLKTQQPQLVPYRTALPILHSYCHGESCQKEFSPKNLYGLGNVDGEGLERYWSRLEPFAGRTQRMTHENRHDMLGSKFECTNRSVDANLPDKFLEKWGYLRGVILPVSDQKPYLECLDELSHVQTIVATERDAQYNTLCETARYIRAVERLNSGHIGTSLASKLKRKATNATKDLDNRLVDFNEKFHEELSMQILFQVATSSKEVKSSFWMALEELVFLLSDVANFVANNQHRVADVIAYNQVDTTDAVLLALKKLMDDRLKHYNERIQKVANLKTSMEGFLVEPEKAGLLAAVEVVRNAFINGSHA